MSNDGAPPERRRRTHQPRVVRRRRRRRRLATAGLLTLAVLALGAWLAVTGYQAKGQLEAARTQAQAARAAVVAGDPATARTQAVLAGASASQARESTSGPAWVLASHVPLLGRPFDATRQIAVAVDDLATDVLGPASDAALALSPATLRPAGGTLNLPALVAARPALAQAAAAAGALATRVDAIPAGTRVPQIDDARDQLVTQTHDIDGLLSTADTAATLLPAMLGGDGQRGYFLAVQTNAEARATGGLVGAFGVLRADGGTVTLDDQGANTGLQEVPGGAVDLGPEYDQLWGAANPTSKWINSNVSAHFPYAAQIWTSLWQRQSGQSLDGAVAVDPVALSYLLRATGPVTLPSGEQVSADTVVALTGSDVYARFADNDTRKAYLQSIVTAVVSAVTNGGDTTVLLTELGRAAGEGRISVYSTRADEQAVLQTTPLAHVVPEDAAPYAGVVVNNSSNGKLDYYLGREVVYRAGPCEGATRRSTVTVTLRNRAPATGLPEYVTIQGPTGSPGPPGTNGSAVSLYATGGAQLAGVTVDGQEATAAAGAERGHPVFTTGATTPPGGTTTIVFELVEPTSPGTARTPGQALVAPVESSSAVPDCAAGASNG